MKSLLCFFASSLLRFFLASQCFLFTYAQVVGDRERELNMAMKAMNKEKKELDKVLEDMSSDAVLDQLRSGAEQSDEVAQAKKDLKVLDMFVKADVSARGSEALMDGSSKKSRSNMLREMILFMQQRKRMVGCGMRQTNGRRSCRWLWCVGP